MSHYTRTGLVESYGIIWIHLYFSMGGYYTLGHEFLSFFFMLLLDSELHGDICTFLWEATVL